MEVTVSTSTRVLSLRGVGRAELDPREVKENMLSWLVSIKAHRCLRANNGRWLMREQSHK